MTERLIIRNFASIEEIDIALSNINVLIGPQATGKSICAKSLYYFKSFLSDFLNAVETGQTKREFDTAFLKKFQRYFSLENLENKNFYLRYEVGDTFIQIEQNKSKPRLTYSEYYRREMNTWRNAFKNLAEYSVNTDDLETARVFLENYVARGEYREKFFTEQVKILGDVATYSQVFIPAGRSFFAILQRSIFSFLSSNNAIDPFLTEFGSFYERSKRPISADRKSTEDERDLRNKINNLVEPILQGKYIRERGTDFLLLSDGRKVNVANSSSGQQEMLPLALILSNLPSSRTDSKGNAVYIEEPEAHLFPTAQRNIVELIATIYNRSKAPAQFIITTHSPYILAAFNNLLYAGNISSELPASKLPTLEEIIPEEQLLKAKDIRVYSLQHGTARSILSEETGLISTNTLDAVSNELAIQFDNILDVE